MSGTVVGREGWTGSDLSARTEVVRYLKQRGGKVEHKGGFASAEMRDELGRGRALSQLLADMEEDGMIRRDIRGRRTFKIELLDDWGLVPKVVAARAAPTQDEASALPADLPETQEGLEQLADALLAIVVRRASAPPAPAEDRRQRQESKQLTDRLRAAETALSKAQAQLDDERAARTTAESRAAELGETVKLLEHNLEVLNVELNKPRRAERGGRGVSIASRLTDEDRATLGALMRALPETPTSKPRPEKRTQKRR